MENAQVAGIFHEILGMGRVGMGACKRLEEARKTVPRGVVPLMQIPHGGPRKVMQVYRELGIATVDALREACAAEW